jgi:hypothetical protein
MNRNAEKQDRPNSLSLIRLSCFLFSLYPSAFILLAVAGWGNLVYAQVPTTPTQLSTQHSSLSTSLSAKPVNLVKNGGFEEGDKCPAGWLIRYARVDLSELTDIHALDHLTIFWDTTHSPTGKCIKMDSDVNQKEVHRRMEELIANPDAPFWPKTPTKPPKYDTAAGLEGVSFWSDPIPVEKGKMYRMSVDCMGRMEGIFFPKMFVRGFGMMKDPKGQIVKRKLYDTYVSCRVPGPGQWGHFTQTFSPTERTPAVAEIRVMLFAYWPPGLYYWDNVEIAEVPEAEAAAIRAAKAKEQPPKETPRPTPRTHKPGESFTVEQEEPMTLPEK